MTSIEENAFDQSGLVSIKIPNSVNSIEDSAFWDCSSLEKFDLTEFNLDSAIPSLGDYVFEYSTNVKFYVNSKAMAEKFIAGGWPNDINKYVWPQA